MSLFNNRATYSLFRVNGPSPAMFNEEHIALLNEHAAGRQRMIASDGIDFGWSAGQNILDTKFDLAKNIINDFLVFGMRIDAMRLPADLLKAYTDIDLASLSANNPSGFASKAQKREARESARDRLEQEAKDGRYTKRKVIDVAWDLRTNRVYYGATSATHVDRLHLLFKNTFGCGLDAITAGASARSIFEGELTPTEFIKGLSPSEYWWIPDEANKSFLGNEFLLWLWYQCDEESAEIRLSDGSNVVFMFSNTLSLDCPRGQTGSESYKHESPIRLPEAMRAIQAGKMPRKAGLTLVRHGVQYEFTLHAESLAIGSAKIPSPEDEDPRARLDSRADQLRDLSETVDLLFEAFVRLRTSNEWAKELERMRRWLER
jgi:hypothetical protein